MAVRRRVRRILTRVVALGVFALLLLAGLCVMLYPSMSNYINEKNQSRVINHYNTKVSAMSTADYSQLIKLAKAYNARLAQSGLAVHDAFENGADESDRSGEYWKLLNVDGTGIMGYLIIDKIHVRLPIYHGTDSLVLQKGAGHIQGSSLPVGGENTHAVLSAHTGLPSAEYFTNLDQMKMGDTFQLHVLGQTLTYQVDQILTVLPYQVDALSIIPGGDYVTLVTCTPYGINSHRLLVRGKRIATPASETGSAVSPAQRAKLSGLRAVAAWFGRIGSIFVAAGETAYEHIVTGLVIATERCLKLLGIPY